MVVVARFEIIRSGDLLFARGSSADVAVEVRPYGYSAVSGLAIDENRPEADASLGIHPVTMSAWMMDALDGHRAESG